MDLQQIYYVLEVAKFNSFSRAASTLFVSQPSVSRRISALEKELNTKLFYRDTHSVYLTKSGIEFCDYAEAVVKSYEALLDHFDVDQRFSSRSIQIGVFPFYKFSPLRNLLNDYLSNNKNISINISVIDTIPAYELLLNDELDFAIVKDNVIDKMQTVKGLKFMELGRESAYVLTNRKNYDDKSIRRPEIDLHSHRFHIDSNDSPSFDHAKKALGQIGIVPVSSMHNTTDADLILDMVKSSDTDVLVTESIARYFRDDNYTVIKVDPELQISTYIVCRENFELRGDYLDFYNYITCEYSKHALDSCSAPRSLNKEKGYKEMQ